MNGPVNCPNCDSDTEVISTTNEWNLYCRTCDVRFKTINSVNGVFSFPDEDSGRCVMFVGHRYACVAFDREWPELEYV